MVCRWLILLFLNILSLFFSPFLCFSGDTLFQIIERRKSKTINIEETKVMESEGEDDDNNKRTAIAIVSSSENNIGQKRTLLQNVKNNFTKPFKKLKKIWNEQIGFKFFRAFRAGMIGALNNGLIHYNYYKWIDKRFPYHLFTTLGPKEGLKFRLSVAWAKYWTEWPTIGVYKIVSMMGLTTLLSKGGNWEKFMDKIKSSFMLTWLRSLQIWPIYDTALYAYVPVTHRPLFNTFMSILWGGYLSSISQPDSEDAFNHAANMESKDVANPYFTGKFTIVEGEDIEEYETNLPLHEGENDSQESELKKNKDEL